MMILARNRLLVPARPAVEIPRRPHFRARPVRAPGRRFFDRLRVPTRNMADGDEMQDASGNVILDASGNVLLDDGAGCASCCTTTVACSHCTSTPATILVLFASVTICTTCVGDGTFLRSVKVSGTLTGPFCCAQDSVNPCLYVYDGTCGVTQTNYDASTCSSCPVTSTRLKVQVTLGSDTTVSVDAFMLAAARPSCTQTNTMSILLFSGDNFARTSKDCATSITVSNNNNPGSCPSATSTRQGINGTATLTFNGC